MDQKLQQSRNAPFTKQFQQEHIVSLSTDRQDIG